MSVKMTELSPTARLGLLLEIAHETASDSLRAEAVTTATGTRPAKPAHIRASTEATWLCWAIGGRGAPVATCGAACS